MTRGSLEIVAPRVYGVTGTPCSTALSALRLGLLSLGPDAVVSHEAAAGLHEFDRSLPDAVEFTVPRTGRRGECPFRIHTTNVLPEVDVVTVDGYRCTSATRTVIDLARARISRYRLEAAIDSAAQRAPSSPVVLVGASPRCVAKDAGACGCSTACCSTPVGTRCSSADS